MSKKIIFSIIAVLAIVALSLTLVFVNKEDTNEEDEDYNYAASFVVNLPDKIQILKGTSIKFKSGYIEVSPSKMIEKLNIEITSKSTYNLDGLTFESNSLKAISAGNYTLKFKMPRSLNGYFTKSISIEVFGEEESSDIYQTQDYMIVDESLNLSDLFEIKDNKSYSISTDEKSTYSKNCLTAKEIGESNVNFVFTDTYIEYVYQFKITIKEHPQYVITLSNVIDNTIKIDLHEDETSLIYYIVTNREEEEVTQEVSLESCNTDIIAIEKISNPFIKIKALKTGETKIIISLIEDPTVQIEVNIIVI